MRAGGGEHRLELQVSEAERRGLRRHVGEAHVLGRGVGDDLVDDARAVDTGDDGHPPADGGGFEPSHLLHPA